jgi:predicted RNA-binding Zn ribbon-like protein
VLAGSVSWLDLVNTGTASSGGREERLDSPARLAGWLEAEGIPPRRPPGPADLAAAHELRAALASLALAVLGRTPADAAALAVLERHLAADRPPRVGAAAAGLVREPPPDAAVALGWVARQALGHLAGPRPAPLRACADPACGRLYLDPGGRRRWCSPDRCGSRARVRAFRRRQADR